VLSALIGFGYVWHMTLRPGHLASRSGALAAAAMLWLLVAAGTAWPQAAPQPPSLGVQEPPPAAPDQPAPQPQNSGLIHEMGRLIDKIVPTVKSPGETIDDFNARAKDVAKDAGDALSRLAKPGGMVSGRTFCPAGSDGVPDCKAAADKLCQSKGYREGRSLNTDSAQTCSAKVLIPGRQRKPDDCRNDNYVTTALCQ
jgi:hypothetical protein